VLTSTRNGCGIGFKPRAGGGGGGLGVSRGQESQIPLSHAAVGSR
jgi:hypothetical protein